MHHYSWRSGAAHIHTQTGAWPSAGPGVMDNTDCTVKTKSDVEIRIPPACNNSASMSPRDSYIPSVINTNSQRGCDSPTRIHHTPEILEKTAICTKPRLCSVVLNQRRVICVQRSNGMTLVPLVVVRSLIDTNTQYLTRVIPSKEEDHVFRRATKLAGIMDYPKLPVLVLLNEIMQCTGKPDMDGNVTARWHDAPQRHDVIEPLGREQNLRASTISTGLTKTQEDLPPPLIDASSATLGEIQLWYETHQAGPRPCLLSSSDKLTTSPAGSLLNLDSQFVNKQNLRSHLKKLKNKQVIDQVLSAPIASQPGTVHPFRPYGKPPRPSRSTGASTVHDFNPSLPLINFPAHSLPTTAPIFSHNISHTKLSMQPAATSTGVDNGLMDNTHVPTASRKSNHESDHRRDKLINPYHEPLNRTQHGNSQMSNSPHGNQQISKSPNGNARAANPPINRSHHGNTNISSSHYGNPQMANSHARAANPEISRSSHGNTHTSNSHHGNADEFIPAHGSKQINMSSRGDAQISNYHYGNAHESISAHQANGSSQIKRSGPSNARMFSPQHDNIQVSSPVCDSLPMSCYRRDNEHVTSSRLDNTLMSSFHHDNTPMSGPQLDNTQVVVSQLDYAHVTESQLLSCQHANKQVTSSLHDNTQLTGPHLDNTQLTGPHLDNTQLTGPHLDNTQLAGSLHNNTQLTGSPFDPEQINSPPLDNAHINGSPFIKEEDGDSYLSSPLSADPGHQRPQQQTPRDSTFSQLALPSKSDRSSPPQVKPEKSLTGVPVHPLAPELTDISLSSTPPARVHPPPPPAPPSAATELHQSPAISPLKKEPHQITSFIRPVLCRDRSISCLVKDGEQYALVEALCRVFFRNHTVNLLIKICSDINGSHLKELNKTEEKLFIDYFGLNVDKLMCNKVFPIDKFDSYLGHIEYMLGYWTEKPEIKTEDCDGDVKVIEITNLPPAGSSREFSIVIDD